MNINKDVGLVVDWLVTYAGAERVVKEFIDIFPDAEIHTTVEFLDDESKKHFVRNKINTSFIQKLPFAKTKYQKYLPFMTLAVEQLDVSKHDIVLSSSHAVAKGILTGPD